MTLNQLVKAFQDLSEEAKSLMLRSELRKQSSIFLNKESEKLIALDVVGLADDEQETYLKQLMALQKRIELEVKMIHEDDSQMIKLMKRLDELAKIRANGNFDTE